MSNFRTYTRRVIGESDFVKALAEMAHWSCWFEVMPIPNDEYEISVKEEISEKLNILVDYEL